MVDRLVISIGLNLIEAASNTATSTFFPSLLNCGICQSIEKLRSEKTDFHGKTDGDFVLSEPIYTYFIVNSVATVGLFLNSYFKTKFPKPEPDIEEYDDLPF